MNESKEKYKMNAELIGKIFRIGTAVLNNLINQDNVTVSILKRKMTDSNNSIIVGIHEITRISDNNIEKFRKYEND